MSISLVVLPAFLRYNNGSFFVEGAAISGYGFVNFAAQSILAFIWFCVPTSTPALFAWKAIEGNDLFSARTSPRVTLRLSILVHQMADLTYDAVIPAKPSLVIQEDKRGEGNVLTGSDIIFAFGEIKGHVMTRKKNLGPVGLSPPEGFECTPYTGGISTLKQNAFAYIKQDKRGRRRDYGDVRGGILLRRLRGRYSASTEHSAAGWFARTAPASLRIFVRKAALEYFTVTNYLKGKLGTYLKCKLQPAE
ncbi:hypothetical protein EVAR_31542_1 [Eumeta japonica]|uniref:Uncharacterized protein n=1 Tax=Eumeta variegata TaxID=151549 RepID=A0A4C1V782_EUMVA|nr:hypothetical protein EVAR_31542_1 [Eumeta japonica]